MIHFDFVVGTDPRDWCFFLDVAGTVHDQIRVIPGNEYVDEQRNSILH